MPHFYDLSTNNEHYLADEDKTRGQNRLQADFRPRRSTPSAYLLEESKGYLKGDDIYTRSLKARKQQLLEMEAKLKTDNLSLGKSEVEELGKIDRELLKQVARSEPGVAIGIHR
jgi:hypothetical protein